MASEWIQLDDGRDDVDVYRYLASTRPDGKVMLSDSEQEEFEHRMGLGKYR